jgi:hypothetical protein
MELLIRVLYTIYHQTNALIYSFPSNKTEVTRSLILYFCLVALFNTNNCRQYLTDDEE